jgi:hypothetical protein
MNELLELAKRERARIERGEPEPAPVSRPPTFIEKTGQVWKLRLATGLNVAGVLCWLAPWSIQLDPHASALLRKLGMLLFLLAYPWAAVAIRCPRCKTRVVRHAHMHHSLGEADYAARTQPVCPACGYDPQDPTSNRPAGDQVKGAA